MSNDRLISAGRYHSRPRPDPCRFSGRSTAVLRTPARCRHRGIVLSHRRNACAPAWDAIALGADFAEGHELDAAVAARVPATADEAISQAWTLRHCALDRRVGNRRGRRAACVLSMNRPRRSPQCLAEAAAVVRSRIAAGATVRYHEVRLCRSQNCISDTPRVAFERRAPRPIPILRPFSSKWPRRGRGSPIRRRSLGLHTRHLLSRTGATDRQWLM